jgi:hypothetical protein
MLRVLIITLLSFLLLACAVTHTTTPPTITSPRVSSELAQGKRDFENGYYKRAMHQLLPLACEGSAEAQYAVGYMYYYGYGVAQDTDVGYFWIKRSADLGYQPAIKAMLYIDTPGEKELKPFDRLKLQ